MAKIFRIHAQGGANTVNHWGVSNKISAQAIGSIQDPNGASAAKEITSIPSPFARMDLVKTAFAEVVKSGNINGISIYHKMVSDCLDIGQIFFNISKYSSFIEIIEWNRNNDLTKLSASPISGHKQLADTYNLFLLQDAQTYNFGKMQSVFILKCTHPSALAGNNYIGATSPATLFFSSANDLSYVSKLIDFGGDKPFDGAYAALHKRDIEYQKFWYLLRLTAPAFAQLFPEVDNYLTMCYNVLSLNERNIINQLTAGDYQNFVDISVGGAGNPVNVLGIPIKGRPDNTANIQNVSDFVIASSHTVNNVSPLVLPVDIYNQPLRYVSADWDPNTKTPYSDNTPLSNRSLPADGSPYPYLTISDFLEDTIIQLPFEINTNAFFDSNCGGKGYLLPLKNLFFDFFTVEQLKKNLHNGKKMFEFQSIAGGVKVILRIPIKNQKYIEYNRLYFSNNIPDISKNEGALINENFDMALFPNIRFTVDANAFYRIGLISEFSEAAKYNMKYSSQNNIVSSDPVIRNLQDTHYKQCKIYCIENTNFDYISIACNNHQGIIIPAFGKEDNSNAQFTIAVDLGTTNTHIEYSIDGNPSKPLDIAKQEAQIQLLSKDEDTEVEYTRIFDFDMIPGTIGANEEFKFPARTALSESANTNWDNAVFSFANANIPFPYEKRTEYKYNKITVNLKWSNEPDNMKRVKTYIESLFFILRNKVILNNGDLKKTKIIWFYPISMTQHRFGLFKSVWEEAYKKYFSPDTKNIISMTESVAPYEFYKGSAGNTSNMVTVDIGGGTSDIVIAQNGEVKYITSFRFAANAVLGDGYATNQHGSVQNGIVRQFKEAISKTLESNGMDELTNVYKAMDNKNISSDFASFFFSLKNNRKIIEKNIADRLDYNKMLQADSKQKIVFVFFYAAIIYHLANIMKAKGMPMPRHITFSGNGSKVIQILTPDADLLAKFTKLIFEKIYKKPYPADGLTIIQSPDTPKEATCKGGISSPFQQDYSQIIDRKVVLKGTDNQSFITNETYGNINDDNYISETTEEVKRFIQFALDLNNDFSFKNNFGVNSQSLAIAKSECLRDLRTYTANGLAQKRKEVSDDDKIEETFFFYPLTGMLYALSSKFLEII